MRTTPEVSQPGIAMDMQDRLILIGVSVLFACYLALNIWIAGQL